MNTITRSLRTVAGIGAAAALVASLAACTSSGAESEPLTVGLTYTPNVQFAAFYVAEERGYFEEAGLDVELRHHGEAEDLFGALSTSTEQVVFAGGDEILQARSSGIDVTSIATLYNAYPATLIVPEDSPIQTAADVRGHTIGTPGPFGQTYFALLSLLQTNGMTTTDVDIQSIGYTQQVALTTGKVDGVMGFVNNDAVQFEQAGFPVRTIDVMPEDQQLLVGPALGATSATITSNPESLTKLLEALSRATADLVADPAAAVEIAANYDVTLSTPEAKAAALATLEATIPMLSPKSGRAEFENDATTWTAMQAFMEQQALLGETPVTPEESYTNDLLPAGA